MPNGRDNTVSQMTELITQNYNHACIVCWGVSNEITISTKDKADMLDNHHMLNDLCHKLDPTRLTTLACYAMCGPFNRSAHITDLVSWNLYLGWYVPGFFLNDLWMDFFHLVYPNRPLGFSEYGAEAMPNLHSLHPRRGDHTEDYQAFTTSTCCAALTATPGCGRRMCGICSTLPPTPATRAASPA